jgi:outer membrane protein W
MVREAKAAIEARAIKARAEAIKAKAAAIRARAIRAKAAAIKAKAAAIRAKAATDLAIKARVAIGQAIHQMVQDRLTIPTVLGRTLQGHTIPMVQDLHLGRAVQGPSILSKVASGPISRAEGLACKVAQWQEEDLLSPILFLQERTAIGL